MRYARLTIVMAVLLGIASLVGDRADASGMGFRFNKGICGPVGGGFVGLNFVSLPFDNPYTNAQDVCQRTGDQLPRDGVNGKRGRGSGPQPDDHARLHAFDRFLRGSLFQLISSVGH